MSPAAMATVPLMCAAACGGLSLVLASNMSRLRNKARRVTRAIPGRTTAGDVEAEKRFLAEPEFQKASLAQRNTLEYTPLYAAFMLHLHERSQRTGTPPSLAADASSLLAAASCFLYAGNALAVGQKVNWARFLSAWGRYVAMAGLIAATAMNA